MTHRTNDEGSDAESPDPRPRTSLIFGRTGAHRMYARADRDLFSGIWNWEPGAEFNGEKTQDLRDSDVRIISNLRTEARRSTFRG